MPGLRRVIPRRSVRLGAGVVVVCAAVGFGVTMTERPTSPRSVVAAPRLSAAASRSSVAAALPNPSSGFVVPKPTQLADGADVTRWAPVISATVARQAPSPSSPVVNTVPLRTPEGTANLVVATAEITRGGVPWVRASLPSLTPRGLEGWVPRSALGGWSFVDTRLIVDRRRLSLTLRRGHRVIFTTRVGVGTPDDPTPAGRYYVRNRLTEFASPAYGPLSFGTSARAHHLTDWPGGGYIGIHGTDEPGLIPGRVSHGCIRLTDPAIVALGRLLPVGTPVIVQ